MVTSPQAILFRIQTILLELRVLNTSVINLKKQGHHLLFCNLLTVQHLVVWELNKNTIIAAEREPREQLCKQRWEENKLG